MAVPVAGRIPHPRTEIVESLQDVGVAAQQAGHQHGQQQHHDTENDGKSNHRATSRRGAMTTTGMRPVTCV